MKTILSLCNPADMGKTFRLSRWMDPDNLDNVFRLHYMKIVFKISIPRIITLDSPNKTWKLMLGYPNDVDTC